MFLWTRTQIICCKHQHLFQTDSSVILLQDNNVVSLYPASVAAVLLPYTLLHASKMPLLPVCHHRSSLDSNSTPLKILIFSQAVLFSGRWSKHKYRKFQKSFKKICWFPLSAFRLLSTSPKPKHHGDVAPESRGKSWVYIIFYTSARQYHRRNCV